MNTILAPLVQRRQLAPNTLEITCDLQDEQIPFEAGQHFKVSIDNLLYPDQKGKTRIFNAVSSPNNENYISFAFSVSDSGYKKTIGQIPLGSKLEIKGPYGMFTIPQNEMRQIIMVCDGIGVTPCVSFILDATEQGHSNEMHLLYSDDCPYVQEIKNIQQQNRYLQCQKFSKFDSCVIKKFQNYQNTLWLVAGTPNKTNAIKQQLLKLGISGQNIKVEEFAGY